MTQHEEGRNDRIRRRSRERRSQFLADSARSFNPQGTDLTGPSIAFAADPEVPKVGLARMFLNEFVGALPVVGPVLGIAMKAGGTDTRAGRIGDQIADNVRGAARGVIGGVDAGLESLISLEGQFLKSTGIGEYFGGEPFLDWWDRDADERNVLHIGKDRIAAPETTLGGLTEGLAQVGVGLAGVGKIMAGIKLGRGAIAAVTSGRAIGRTLTMPKMPALLQRIGNSTIGKWTGKAAKVTTRGAVVGAAIDAAFFDPLEERMSNLISNSPEWFGSALTNYLAETDVVQFLKANPDDDEAVGRFKNVVEGLIMGAAFGSVLHGANVLRLKWLGHKVQAAELAARFVPQEAQGLIQMDNGKWRLAMNQADKARLVEWKGFDGEGLAGLDVVSSGSEGTVRTFVYETPEGPGALRGAMKGDHFEIDMMGRWDEASESIRVTSDLSVEARRASADEIQAEFDQTLADGRAAGLSEGDALGVAERRASEMRQEEISMGGGELDESFQNSLSNEELMTIGAELHSYIPEAAVFDGFRLKSGKPFSYPTSRLRQEVFTSKGDAAVEALSATDGRNMRNAPLDKMSADQFTEMEKIKNSYESNRTERTIRKGEAAWALRNRTNMGAGAPEMVAQIADIARVLETAGTGSRKVMIRRGDNALRLIKASDMAGIAEHPALANLDPVAVRRAAGLLMESLGSDVVRYTRRTQQGGSNLSYLQLGRALDQMMHIEEALTGRPSMWFEKHKKLFDDGAFGNPAGRKMSNADMPEGAKADSDVPVWEGTDVRGQVDKVEADVAAKGEATRARQAEMDQPGGVNDPMGPDAPVEHMLAGVAPGPRSLRNLSKGEIQRLGIYVSLADGEPHGIMVALKTARLEAASAGRGAGWKQTLIRWRIASMLSGYATHAVNVVSTTIQTALLPTELMIGGALTGQPKYIVQGAHQITGMALEMGDAWRATRRAYKNGKGSLDPDFMTRELDAGRFEGYAAFANVPADLLTSADEFFKVLNYRGRIRAKTMTQAGVEGLDHVQTAKRVNDALEASQTADGVGLNVDALEYSRNATFTDALQGRAGRISGLLRGDDAAGVAGSLWVPFIRTPHNIAKNIIVRSPLALANMKAHNAAIRAGGAEAAERMGRMATAAAMVATAGILVESGRIQGRGPMNPTTRAAWKAAGYEPFTITYGEDNKKFHYNKLSSLFGPLALVADMWYVGGNMKNPEQVMEGMMQITASLLDYTADQGFVGNVGEMFDAILSGDGTKLQDFAASVATDMVMPKAISQFTAFDDNLRETEGYIDNLYALTPGLSETLPPERNIFREPIFKAPGSWDRLLNPFTSLGPQENPDVAMALFRIGKHMSLPDSKKYGGRIDLKDIERWGKVDDMSPYEYWQEKTANFGHGMPTLKQDLTDLVKGPLWAILPVGSEDWPGGPRYEEVARIVTLAQEIGWIETLTAFPDLMDADINEKLLKVMGRVGGKEATDALLQDLEM